MTTVASPRLVRPAGLWCAAGAAVMVVVSLITVLDDSLGRPGTWAFRYSGIVLVAGHLLVFAGILALARSGVAGSGPLSRIGLLVAAGGALLIAAAELILRFAFDLGEVFFGIGTPLAGVGLVLGGVGVLRAGRWSGPRRFVPLLCGLYVFAVLYPAETLAGGASYPAIAGWNLCFVLLGAAIAVDLQR
ncbi:hypothetical protein ODJ79_38040 [Actinoplanes sp. KI2]|uniref:hypothetical protein n=1 Tax=Actinoplanes sp. KI2 TaxID=2983315 RepID=UPI0021D5CB6C|nr:hypothetical protein [Actinoplanes sp. KI2]MCU7729552.1 hypothetical protein [Actinoplanes sp. KI2]